MRPLDELARLWNDARARLPRSAWSWPLVAALGGAVIVLVGTSQSDVGTASNAVAPIEATSACQEQTWPYLTDACLQRNRPASAQAPSHVRVLNYEPALANAAIGATPWAAKETVRSPQNRQKQTRPKEATRDRDRTVTVRSGRQGRNAERERVYSVPRDPYAAYGYVPRR